MISDACYLIETRRDWNGWAGPPQTLAYLEKIFSYASLLLPCPGNFFDSLIFWDIRNQKIYGCKWTRHRRTPGVSGYTAKSVRRSYIVTGRIRTYIRSPRCGSRRASGNIRRERGRDSGSCEALSRVASRRVIPSTSSTDAAVQPSRSASPVFRGKPARSPGTRNPACPPTSSNRSALGN